MWKWRCNSCRVEYGPTSLVHVRRSTRCLPCANKANGTGYEEISGSWLANYRHSARKRGYAWEVTPRQLWTQWLLQSGSCAYTGWVLTHDADASLDRIDNRQGYIPGNVQWVHTHINRLKHTFTEEEFLLLCRAVAAFDRPDLALWV